MRIQQLPKNSSVSTEADMLARIWGSVRKAESVLAAQIERTRYDETEGCWVLDDVRMSKALATFRVNVLGRLRTMMRNEAGLS